MRLSRNLQKLANAGPKAGSSRSVLIIPSRHASTSSVVAAEDRASSFHHESLINALQPPSIPIKEASSQRPVPSSFFDPSLPLPSRVRAIPNPKPSPREADVIISLKEMLQQPNTARDEVFAARVWQHYQSLSPAFRRSLDIMLLQTVFRYVLPNSRYVKQLTQITAKGVPKHVLARSRSARNTELGTKWERRLRTVAADIMASSAADVNPQVFITALDKLAQVGEKEGCEAIIKEIRHRYDSQLTYKQMRTMYTHALRSVSKWLRNHAHRSKTRQNDLLEAVEAARRLIAAMQKKDISPNATTAENLLNIARIVSSTITDPSTVQSFDKLSEVILTNGYSLDLNSLAFDADSVKLKPSVKLAVIDLLGRKGRLYEMLAAFDSLFPGDVDRLPAVVQEDVRNEEEEEVPTLSAMLAAEQAERAQRGWFGQRTREEETEVLATAAETSESMDPQSSRQFNDFLPAIPTPFDILTSDSLVSDSSISDEILRRLQDPALVNTARPVDGEGAVVSSVLAMLSRAWLSKTHVALNDTKYKDVSLHVLRIALRAAHVEQARWIYSLSPGSASGQTSGPAKVDKPSLRVEPNWFLAAWRTVRWSRSSDRRGRYAGRAVLAELDSARERIDQERIILGNILVKVAEQERPVDATSPHIEETEVTSAGAETLGPSPESSTPTSSQPQPVFSLEAHLTELEELSLALAEIQETISANLEVAFAKKARHNAARVVKLAERRELAAALGPKGRKRAARGDDGVLSASVQSVQRDVPPHQDRWVGQGQGQAALA